MKFIIFIYIIFIYIPFVCSELHTFITTYTGTHGKTTEETPEFSAVTILDGQQIDYYDSNTMELIPKQPWMKEFASEELWKDDTEIRKQVQQIYKLNIRVLMQRFNHSHGVHTYQRMYGCEWDDETGDSHGFDQYTYDGEDFISLDLKELRYTAHVPQAKPTVMKWNDDKAHLHELHEYFQDYECIFWLKEFWHFSKAAFKKAEECKENQYACVVEHQTLTEPIQKILTEDETRRSNPGSDTSYIMYPVVSLVIILVILLIGLCVLWNYGKVFKARKKRTIYVKTQSLHPGPTQSLISPPSCEFPSPPEACDS